MELSPSEPRKERTFTIQSRPAPAMGGMPGLTGSRGVPLRVPLPFLVTGICAAALWGLLAPWILPEALVALTSPHVLVLVHTATLGWLTMTIMGATFQLIPVIVVSPLQGTRFISWQYPLYLGGVLLLLAGFWWSYSWLLIIGGTLIVIAALHYVTILGLTLARATTHPLTTRFLMTSCIYFCLVVGLGLTAALNLQFAFLGTSLPDYLLLHIICGVLGWLSCTLIGVSYTLVRLFSLAHAHTDRIGRIIFAALNIGILGLVLWAILLWPWLFIGSGLLLCATFALFFYDVRKMFQVRQRKVLDTTQYHSIVAVIYGVLVLLCGIPAIFLGWHQPAILVALGVAVLVGWIGQSIVGYLYKIVPFLIWNTCYGPLVGKKRVPLMRDLLYTRWQWISFWLINLGLPVLLVCLVLRQVLLVQISSGFLGIGLCLAAANIVNATLHLAKKKEL